MTSWNICRFRSLVWLVLSPILSSLLLIFLFSRQRWDILGTTLCHIDIPLIVLAVIGSIIDWCCRIARWRWIVRQESINISWAIATVSVLGATGVGLATPARGGEIIRPLLIGPTNNRLRLAAWVVLERIYDLIAVGILCLFALYLMSFGWALSIKEYISVSLQYMVLVCVGGGFAVAVALHYHPKWLWGAIARILPNKMRHIVKMHLSWQQFVWLMITSLLIEILSILVVFICLRSLLPVSLIIVLILTPIIMLHNIIPATPGGFGVREGLAVTIYGWLGYSGEAVLSGYLINGLIVLVIPGCVGMVALAIMGLWRKIPEVTRTHPLWCRSSKKANYCESKHHGGL